MEKNERYVRQIGVLHFKTKYLCIFFWKFQALGLAKATPEDITEALRNAPLSSEGSADCGVCMQPVSPGLQSSRIPVFSFHIPHNPECAPQGRDSVVGSLLKGRFSSLYHCLLLPGSLMSSSSFTFASVSTCTLQPLVVGIFFFWPGFRRCQM
jgi:hypothetical protein